MRRIGFLIAAFCIVASAAAADAPKSDVGVVVLLDRRVVTKRYGPLVLAGLPRAERVIGSWAQVRTKCEDFFARHGMGVLE